MPVTVLTPDDLTSALKPLLDRIALLEAKGQSVVPTSILPPKILLTYYWPWGTHPTIPVLMSQAPQYNVLSYISAIPSGNGNANMMLNGGPETGMVQAIAAWKASGRVALLMIANAGANGIGINLNTPGDTANFVNSISGIVRTCGFQGIDWDLEDSFTQSSQSAVVNASAQLKAIFGPTFIISAVPRAYEVRGGGIWAQALKALGTNLDLITLQEYDSPLYADPLIAQIQTDYADLTSQGFPASKILLGTCTLTGTSTPGGAATAQVYGNALAFLRTAYGIRGATVWQSASDQHDAPGWAYAKALT